MKTACRTTLVVLTVLTLLPACRRAATPPSPEVVWSREIPWLMIKGGIPGLSIAVIRDGQIEWTGSFGVRSRDTNEPVRDDTIFEAASLSKTVAAYAALRLVERGQLDLDKPLAGYYPYEPLAGDERYKKITARMVLTHTTGLPNWGTTLVRDPGTRFGYSGEGFLYLGRTMGKLTGMSFQDLVDQEVFRPLGMTHSSYVWNPTYDATGAAGHSRHGTVTPLRKTTDPNPAASLLTTATDYGRFLCAIMNGQGLKKDTIDQMLTPHVKAVSFHATEPDDHISWGWGWGLESGATEPGFWHWGDNGSLRAYTVSYRTQKKGLVFFTNSENCFTMAPDIVSLIFPDEKQWAFDWLEYDRYDDPKRVARFALEEAFIDGGATAGQEQLDQLRARQPGLLDADALTEVAEYLAGLPKADEAGALLEQVVKETPSHGAAWLGLATIDLGRGRNTPALEEFGKALDLEAKNASAKRGVEWAELAIQADRHPPSVSRLDLDRYAGDYDTRHITLRDGVLYYLREGRPRFRLRALTRDTFALEGYGQLRLRFVSDHEGRVTKLVGLYLNGTSDETPRDK